MRGIRQRRETWKVARVCNYYFLITRGRQWRRWSWRRAKKKRKIKSIYARGKGDGKERGRGLEEEKGGEREKREKERTRYTTQHQRDWRRGALGGTDCRLGSYRTQPNQPMPPPSRSTFSTPLRFQSHHSIRSSTSYPLARIRASIPRRRRAIRSPGGVDSVASTPPGGSCGTLGRLEPPTKWPTDLIDSYLPSPLLLSRLFLPSSRPWLSYVDHHRHRHRRHHHRRRHRHRRRAVPCRAAPAGPPASPPTDRFPDSLLLRFSTRYSFKRPPKDATPLFAQHRLLRQFLPRTSISRFFLPLYDLDWFFPRVREARYHRRVFTAVYAPYLFYTTAWSFPVFSFFFSSLNFPLTFVPFALSRGKISVPTKVS